MAKCEFGKAIVSYSNRIVGGGQVRPLEAKISAFRNVFVPLDRRGLRLIVGMVGCYLALWKNFSSVVAPLTDLLSPKKPFCGLSFVKRHLRMLRLLISAPVGFFFAKSFLLSLDAVK